MKKIVLSTLTMVAVMTGAVFPVFGEGRVEAKTVTCPTAQICESSVINCSFCGSRYVLPGCFTDVNDKVLSVSDNLDSCRQGGIWSNGPLMIFSSYIPFSVNCEIVECNNDQTEQQKIDVSKTCSTETSKSTKQQATKVSKENIENADDTRQVSQGRNQQCNDSQNTKSSNINQICADKRSITIIYGKNQWNIQTDTKNNDTVKNSYKSENTITQESNLEKNMAEENYADEIVRLVNQERVKAGLKEVTPDKQIENAALVRAKEIEVLFSHTRPNGSSFSSILNENGISFRGAGENIAWGQSSPEAVMDAWMNSEGHRANILNPNFKKIGVGYYRNFAGRKHWTQLFTY